MENWLLKYPTRRRVMAAALSACMVFTMLPLQAFAAKPTQNVVSLCEHHPVHTVDCGYTEGTAVTPCTHEHTESCDQEVVYCTHEHTAACYPEDDSLSDHDATPSDAENKEPTECSHICSEDTGCITQEPNCPHDRGEHDDTCGYTKETKGMPCTYICEICNPPQAAAKAPMPILTAAQNGTDWTIDASGNLTISKLAGMTDWRDNGRSTHESTLKTVTIADAVTEILSEAFLDCHNLTQVTADKADYIKEGAFKNCASLTTVSFPEATYISDYAFQDCRELSSACFPAAEDIDNIAFKDCSALATLKLGAVPPVSVKPSSFEGCPTTRALTLVDTDGTALTGDALTTAQGAYKAVDDSAMSGEAMNNNTWYGWTIAAAPVDPGWAIDASGNLTISTPAGMTDWVKNGSGTFQTVTIEETVTKIPKEAFWTDNQLTKVTAPGVTDIGARAFDSCPALTSASFPKATTIDNYAFMSCIALSTLELGAVPPTVGADVFKYCRTPRALALVTADGTALTGDALTKAQTAYKAVDDSAMSGEAANNGTWYGWTTDAPPPPTVTSVAVTPQTANVQTGTTQQFTAVVTGTNSPAQTVTWTVTGGKTGTSISTGGLLTIASDETATTLTVTATSTVDTDKTASCTVNVSTYHPEGDGGSSDSSGSSSDRNSSGKPTESVTGSSHATATVDSNGNLTVNVSDSNISDAVQAAIGTASRNGIAEGGVTAVINVTAPANSTPGAIAVNLPKTVQEQIINGKIGSVVFVIDNPGIAISMSLATITEMNRQANADIQLLATRTDAAKQSAEARNAIGSRPAFDLKATYEGGSKSVTNFGTGTVCVTLPYTLQNGEVAGGLYAAYVDDNGKVNYITNSSYDAENEVLRFSTNRFSVYGIGYKAPIGFTDIADHWAKTDIEFVVNRGLMNGTDDTIFSPDSSMTRGMFVTALGRLAGVDVNNYKTVKFTDVKIDSYYAPYVNWAVDKGILKGTGDTTFAPDQAISRQETAVTMSNYASALGYKVPITRDTVTFADNTSIAGWAAPAVKQMQMAGILNAKSSNLFDPTGAATHGEISAMLHRYVELALDKSTSEGWITNDSGSSMYYRNGKALVGAQTIGGVTYTFNSYGETTRAATTAATNSALPVNGSYTTYRVKKGDYFWKIAKEYNCDIYELAKINGKTVTSYIYVGEVLRIPQ